MRRRRLAVLVAGLIGLVMLPAISGAAPVTSSQITPAQFLQFCAEAQKTIANMNPSVLSAQGITITQTTYSTFDDFVASKSGADNAGKRYLTTQFQTWLDTGKTQPLQIRCKMRTGESLNAGPWPAGAVNNPGRFAVPPYFGLGSVADGLSTSPTQDAACSDINQQTIDDVWAGLTPAQQTAAPFKPTNGTLVTVPDQVEAIGPNWTSPFPALQTASGGTVLQVPSKSLITGIDNQGDLTGFTSPRFLGAHYCTLVAPTYLRDVLLGTQAVVG